MRYAKIGCVSSGTLSTRDLLDTLAYELACQVKRQPKRYPRREAMKLVREAYRVLETDDDRRIVGADILDELYEALEEFAPPYCTFGGAEDDPANIGYWAQDPRECGFDGITVDDLADIPKGYAGEILLVNDHGNMTFGYKSRTGKFTSPSVRLSVKLSRSDTIEANFSPPPNG